jgi:hypothetical protein
MLRRTRTELSCKIGRPESICGSNRVQNRLQKAARAAELLTSDFLVRIVEILDARGGIHIPFFFEAAILSLIHLQNRHRDWPGIGFPEVPTQVVDVLAGVEHNALMMGLEGRVWRHLLIAFFLHDQPLR